MANQPRLLLMDEPTAGMAPGERNVADGADQAARDRARHGGALHRAQHGRGVRLRRPHDRAGARPADRAGQAARSATIRRCRRCTSAAARPSSAAAWQAKAASGDAVGLARRRRTSSQRSARAPKCSKSTAGRLVRRGADPLRRRRCVSARRMRRADGPQRRRQVDHAEGAHRHAGASAAARCASSATTSRTSEPHRTARLGLGFVPEDRRVFTDLTVMENLEVGRQPRARTARRCGPRARCSSCSRISARCPTGPAAA